MAVTPSTVREIRKRMRTKMWELVDAEDKDNPLSDVALVRKLHDCGYDVTQDNVTYHRKMAGIPGAPTRRRDGD